MFQSDLTIDSLLLNKDTLGTAIIRSAYDDENKVLSMRASIQRGANGRLVAGWRLPDGEEG
jgi:hypothetical protein